MRKLTGLMDVKYMEKFIVIVQCQQIRHLKQIPGLKHYHTIQIVYIKIVGTLFEYSHGY